MLLLLELRLIRHCAPTFVVAPPFCIGASQPNSTAASPSLRPALATADRVARQGEME
jgi:hypothetical protein